MNKVLLTGRLTAAPDYRQTTNNINVCRFSIAVDRPYQKNKQNIADFIICQAWRATADFVAKYFYMGKPISVEGTLRNNNYIDKNGIKRYETYVLVDNVEFVISDNTRPQQYQPHQTHPAPAPQPQQQAAPSQGLSLDDFDEVISHDNTPS
jgi:single-strand DNA-binding protein